MKRPPCEEIVMGVHCITELLQHYPKKLLQVFVQDSMKKNQRKKTLYRQLQEKKIAITILPKKDLEAICGSCSHQGFVAFIKKRQRHNLATLIQQQKQKKRSVILVLDNIQDPHNVGAIFRCAECFGVDAVLFSNKNGPCITPSVSKVSSGAAEHLPLVETASLEGSLDLLKKEGYCLLAASVTKNAIDFTGFAYPEKLVLILGAEGNGIRSSIAKKVEHTVYIPMRGKVQSLNVSAAAAVFLAFITYRKPVT